MHRVIRVAVLTDYRVDLRFEDGNGGVVDLSHLAGKGVFAAWTDYEAFKRVRIGDSGELAWDDQIDLCPDSLYLRATHQRPEDVFPSLTREATRA